MKSTEQFIKGNVINIYTHSHHIAVSNKSKKSFIQKKKKKPEREEPHKLAQNVGIQLLETFH